MSDGTTRKGNGPRGKTRADHGAAASPNKGGAAASVVDRTATGGERRREARLERNRDEILAAARQLVLEKGTETFSLREVARRADYSPAALYRYFDNKDALLGEIATMAIKTLGSYLTQVPTDLPPKERLVQLGLAYLRFAKENPEQLTLVFNKMSIPVTSWRMYAEHAWPFTIVVDAVRDGVSQGVFSLPKNIEPEDAALGFWSLVHGAATLLQAHLSTIEDDLVRYIQVACEAQADALTRNE